MWLNSPLVAKSYTLSRMSHKKDLTDQITRWLQEKIDNDDGDIGKIFGDHRYRSNDYFQSSDSLRLRHAGYELLKNYFDHEQFEHDRNFYSGEILLISRNINSPFYIHQNRIVLFDHEQIVLCKLSGSVALWMENLG